MLGLDFNPAFTWLMICACQYNCKIEVKDIHGSTYISSTFSRVLVNAGRVDSVVLQYNQYFPDAANLKTQTSVPPMT
jgi:hypothetical protein